MNNRAKVNQAVFEFLLPQLKEYQYQTAELARDVSASIGKTIKNAAEIVDERRRRVLRAERELATCRDQKDADCSGYWRALERCNAELERALRGMRIIEEGAASYRRAQESHRDKIARLIAEGQKIVRAASERTASYQKSSAQNPSTLMLFGAGGSGFAGSGLGAAQVSSSGQGHYAAAQDSETRGNGISIPSHFPAGFASVPMARIRTEGEVRGPQDFDSGQNLDDLRWATKALLDVVLPAALTMRDARSYLQARDAREGRTGPRSYTATYEGFFGDTGILLSPIPDGTFTIVNGRHRIWLLQGEHAETIPARIEGFR